MPEQDAKVATRAEMKRRLAGMTPERRREASVDACTRLIELDAFIRGNVIMLYMPLAGEVDTTAAAVRCFQTQRTVCVPQVDWQRREMRAVEVTSFDDHVMDVDERGLRFPRESRPVVPTTIDLVVVPGLAFDVHGRRLGRGGGYYDRFLARLRRRAATAGLAFEEQIIDEVPVDERDIAVEQVVTDARVIDPS